MICNSERKLAMLRTDGQRADRARYYKGKTRVICLARREEQAFFAGSIDQRTEASAP